MSEGLIFKLSDVSFSYLGRFPALCGINIEISGQECIAVVGANGSGKTTLLHILDALVFPDTGRIEFKGQQLKGGSFDNPAFSRSFRNQVGMVFQNPDVQLFCPSVKEDIYFGPLQLGLEPQDFEGRVNRIIDFLEIRDLLERTPYQLSIGEKRKVAIASCFAIDPQIILLDEPTAGLDPLTTSHIIELLIQAKSSGKTIITATHDLHIVPEIADKVCVLSRDKTIVRYASCQEVLSDEEFLVKNNLIHMHAHRHKDMWHKHVHKHDHAHQH